MKITEKLAPDAFKNDKESHILLDQQICHPCKERFCIYACPANLYALTEKKR
jgi:ferredoxin like protein